MGGLVRRVDRGVRGRHVLGSGLGLAMANRIAARMGWPLQRVSPSG